MFSVKLDFFNSAYLLLRLNEMFKWNQIGASPNRLRNKLD